MAAQEDDEPQAINEYRLHETLGEGSFGLVRRASQVHADGGMSHVAIKTMSKKRLKRKVKMSRQGRRVVRSSELDTVRREIAVQRKLSHANILRLVDALDVEDSDDLHIGGYGLPEFRTAPQHVLLPPLQFWSWHSTGH